MSIYGVTAIRKCGTELYNEARSWACTLDLPYIPRPIHGTLDQLLREKGLKAVLVATIWMPVLQIYGASMTPTLEEGDVVISIKGADFAPGDLVAFYMGNKILVKRCIAGPGQWVNLDAEGNVFVDGKLLDEPYLTEKALGECDLEFPYQVPENRYFCMGDHRSTSVDSRSSAVGCVSDEQIVGKIVFRVWPLPDFGTLR